MRKDENGYIVVETVGAFMLFVFLFASILALVGIVSLQARVHHAITQTAQTLSMYCYIFEVTGTSDTFGIANADTSLHRVGTEAIKSGVDAIAVAANKITGDSLGGGVPDSASDLFSNPAALIDAFLGKADKSAFSEVAIRPLIGRYLRNGKLSGDAYLKSMGVSKGIRGLEILNYDYSSGGQPIQPKLIDRNGSIVIAVRYEVDYSFWGLPLPLNKLRITQSAATRAWLGGEGARYTG